MRLLDLTLPSAEANLALDEACLNQSEATERGAADNFTNVLRLWESPTPFVVIGRGSKRSTEADVAACETRGVPILRRCSGGTAVVAGPGCLMYAVILSYDEHPDLRSVDATHRFVMGRMQQALRTLSPDVEFSGSSDLSVAGRKISGNSLRCKRRHLLYHGTILYDFPLALISELLGTPPRMPEYRREREHGEFVANLPFSSAEIRQAVRNEWCAEEELSDWPEIETNRLVQEQYSQDAWNARI